MKKIKNIAFVLSILVVSASCSSWLDHQPFDSLEADQVYQDERTANSALNGLYLFTRLSTETNPNYPYHHQMQSIMRLGELYLIAADATSDLELKRSWVEKMRNGKGYDPGNVDNLDEAQLNSVIEYEFRKDTYGEGQFFFFAKRKYITSLLNQNNGNTTMSRSKYVPSLPASETDYRTEDTD